jgi:hypothetical protein
MKKIKDRYCYKCGDKFTPRLSAYGSIRQIYCGDRKKKIGCAYKRALALIRKWNDGHKEQLKPLHRKADMKYYSKNKRVILAYQRAYYHAERYLKLINQ